MKGMVVVVVVVMKSVVGDNDIGDGGNGSS